MNFKTHRPKGLHPLNLDQTVKHYLPLYNDNHDKFIERFIDTILITHYNTVLELTLKYKKQPNVLVNAIWESKIFMNYFVDMITNFHDCYFVNELIDDNLVIELLTAVFEESSVSLPIQTKINQNVVTYI
jgi:hypothetical protein